VHVPESFGAARPVLFSAEAQAWAERSKMCAVHHLVWLHQRLNQNIHA